MVEVPIRSDETASRKAPLLEVNGLTVAFPIEGRERRVVAGVSYSIPAGRTLGVVGESGCGKSMTALALMGLVPAPGRVTGSLRFEGRELIGQDETQWRRLRGARIAMVFQEPMTSLNPVMPVGRQIAEAMVLHQAIDWSAAERKAIELIEAVGIPSPKARAKAFPHQLSGGMAQRASLARALVNDPTLLILDEPLGKLDSLTRLTMQGELTRLWQRRGFTVLMVTHDVEEALLLANRVIVFSDRPARIRADLAVDLPYPRHRDHPELLRLRREALGLLGLAGDW